MKKDFQEFKSFIYGKKTAVVGLGISNIPLINFLLDLGAEVTAFDKNSEEKLGSIIQDFRNKGVGLVLGEGYLDKLTGFEVIFKSPSMRIDCDALTRAAGEGAYITSEIEEFVKYCPAKIYGVTGSDGKTTTTSVIYAMFKEAGYKAWVGGNIGTPLFSEIEKIKPLDKVVLELSSFQLMTMTVSPEVAVVTNISPNHLDMHKDMKEYIEAKTNIFRYQEKSDLLILNRENEITNSFVSDAKGTAVLFSSKRKIDNGAYLEEGKLYLQGSEVLQSGDIVIKGIHNVENYLAAFLAVKGEVPLSVMKKVAMTFGGVPHRNQFIGEFNGVKYYNDSQGSSPTRTIATVSVFDKPVILIAGGHDKQVPFEPLAREAIGNIKALVLLGATKHKIREVFEREMKERNIVLPVFLQDTLEAAVDKARQIAEKGDYVVMSPACSSFDMFPNFEIRGNRFREIVASFD